MNRAYDYGDGVVENQLDHLAELGLFTEALPKPVDELPRLARPEDSQASLEERSRAYLHANCSHCHRLWGGGIADFQLQADVSLDKTGIVGGAILRGDFGLPEPALVVPGHPERSVLLHRMKLQSLGRMPHVGSNEVDAAGVALVEAWIRGMR